MEINVERLENNPFDLSDDAAKKLCLLSAGALLGLSVKSKFARRVAGLGCTILAAADAGARRSPESPSWASRWKRGRRTIPRPSLSLRWRKSRRFRQNPFSPTSPSFDFHFPRF